MRGALVAVLASVVVLGATRTDARDLAVGSLRVLVGGYVEGLGVIGTEGGTSQRPGLLTHLYLDANHLGGLRGHLEMRARAGGPFEGAHAGPYDFVHTFQNHSPSMELVEGWVNVAREWAEVRVGVQRFTWGVLDGIPPTDVLNPRDYHDPLVPDFEDNKIGVPAMQLALRPPDVPRLALSDLHVELISIPLAVPSRVPLPNERWFPEAARPPSPLTFSRDAVDVGITDLTGQDVAIAGGVRIPVGLGTANHRTAVSFDTVGHALRLGGQLGRSSWNLYHYSGPETGPNADLQARNIAGAHFVECEGSPSVEDCLVALRVAARAVLRQAHDTVHMTGVDWSRPLPGGTTVRAEAAHFLDRPTLRIARDLVTERGFTELLTRKQSRCLEDSLASSSGDATICRGRVRLGDLLVDRDVVEWGVGIDWLLRGVFLLAQMNQIIGLEATSRLIVSDPETRLTGLARRRFLQDTLELEMRGIYSLERGGWFAFPRISYAITDDLRLRVGYLAIGGTRNSVFGQFGRNDEFVFQLRYGF